MKTSIAVLVAITVLLGTSGLATADVDFKLQGEWFCVSGTGVALVDGCRCARPAIDDSNLLYCDSTPPDP